MSELKEELLNKVTGGINTGETITVKIEFSKKYFSGDITIKAYINGDLKRNLIKTIDASSCSSVDLKLNGTGKKELKIKINNEFFASYELDFELGSYTKIN